MECIDRVDAGSNTVTALQKRIKQSNTKIWECSPLSFPWKWESRNQTDQIPAQQTAGMTVFITLLVKIKIIVNKKDV
jgi:hypothetical protein